jgi:hypothetical protein
MSSEFINDEDEVTKSCDEDQKWGTSITYILIVVVVILAIAVLMNMFGGDCAAYFQGPFPERSDVGVNQFDLQKEVAYLTEKQMNNLGY